MSASTPPAYETVAPPIPLLSGEEPSGSRGICRWCANEMTPRDAISGVVCENVTVDDHRRCHHIMNIRRWKRWLIPLAILLLGLSALRGATTLDFGIAFLQTLLVLISVATVIRLLVYLFQQWRMETIFRSFATHHAGGAMVLLAHPDRIYDITLFLQFLIPWKYLQSVEAVGSDIFYITRTAGEQGVPTSHAARSPVKRMPAFSQKLCENSRKQRATRPPYPPKSAQRFRPRKNMTDVHSPPPDELAPRPWLSMMMPAGTVTAGQAWSPSTDTLVVSYPFVKREFFQRLVSHARRNTRKTILLNLGIGFLLGAMPLGIAVAVLNFAPGSRSITSSIWLALIMLWIGTTLLLPIFSVLISILMFAFIAQITEWTAKNKKITVALSSTGVVRNFDFTETILWQNVRTIEAWEGGILIIPRHVRPQIGIPGSAFADAETADRFSEAAHILWKSNGDMGLVPEETRELFTSKVSP